MGERGSAAMALCCKTDDTGTAFLTEKLNGWQALGHICESCNKPERRSWTILGGKMNQGVQCHTKAEVHAALAQVEAWMAEAGLTLHPEKTRVVDATRKGDGESFALTAAILRSALGCDFPLRVISPASV